MKGGRKNKEALQSSDFFFNYLIPAHHSPIFHSLIAPALQVPLAHADCIVQWARAAVRA